MRPYCLQTSITLLLLHQTKSESLTTRAVTRFWTTSLQASNRTL
nr:MAG TPA: hypothetical protein [Caudoviricetes sp.]